jgi:hypothetical protein
MLRGFECQAKPSEGRENLFNFRGNKLRLIDDRGECIAEFADSVGGGNDTFK